MHTGGSQKRKQVMLSEVADHFQRLKWNMCPCLWSVCRRCFGLDLLWNVYFEIMGRHQPSCAQLLALDLLFMRSK